MKYILSTVLLLSACASGPPPPDWQTNAFAALNGFSSAYLRGNTRLADLEFARAKTEISSTGRADLLARAELIRCAARVARVASLEFDNCAGYQPLAAEAGAEEQTYAAYLSHRWNGLNTALLPAQHRALVMQAHADKSSKTATLSSTEPSLLGAIDDPLARLVAAGVLLQGGQLTPADHSLATETASAQGWRRPLLAWLGVQRKRAAEADEAEVAARLQRRMDLVLQPVQSAQ